MKKIENIDMEKVFIKQYDFIINEYLFKGEGYKKIEINGRKNFTKVKKKS